MTVVLVGRGNYPEIRLLEEAIETRGGEVQVWDTTQWPGDSPLTYEVGQDSVRVHDSVSIDVINGMFVYRNYLFNPREGRLRDRFEQYKTRQVLVQLLQWRAMFDSVISRVDAAGGTVLFPPHTNHWHELKAYQLTEFATAGVPVPSTTFTNDPDVVREFVDTHEKIVAKPVTHGGEPAILTPDDLTRDRLESLSAAPVQFQAYVPGDDVRVYVLDGEIVGATEYVTDGWSFKRSEVENIRERSLRGDVRSAVQAVADRSPISFGAIDVRISHDEFAVLESTPHPRFAVHDSWDRIDVADAVSEYLLTGKWSRGDS